MPSLTPQGQHNQRLTYHSELNHLCTLVCSLMLNRLSGQLLHVYQSCVHCTYYLELVLWNHVCITLSSILSLITITSLLLLLGLLRLDGLWPWLVFWLTSTVVLNCFSPVPNAIHTLFCVYLVQHIIACEGWCYLLQYWVPPSSMNSPRCSRIHWYKRWAGWNWIRRKNSGPHTHRRKWAPTSVPHRNW